MIREFGYGVKLYRNVANLFSATFNDRDPISLSTIYRWVDRFKPTGSGNETRSGIPKTAAKEEESLRCYCLHNVISTHLVEK